MRRPPRNACDGCGQTLDRRRRGHVLLGPIVHDEIWRRLAKPTEALCWQCMLERTRVRLGRMLRLADLRPCRWNRLNEPYSYLDLLIDIEGALPTNLDAWRGVGVPGEFAELPARSRCMVAAPARSRRPGGVAMTDNSEPKIIPFGKYKGRLVEEGPIDDPD